MDKPVTLQRGSVEAIKEILKLGNRISVTEMAAIADKAEAAGGTLVAVDPDGDWCGTGRLHFKWPIPHKDAFFGFLETLVAYRINHEVLINGIVVPTEILVTISRGMPTRAPRATTASAVRAAGI